MATTSKPQTSGPQPTGIVLIPIIGAKVIDNLTGRAIPRCGHCDENLGISWCNPSVPGRGQVISITPKKP
jgi:hypothetical protein